MYQSIIVNEFNNDDKIIVQENSLEDLQKSLNDTNVIIKVHASPINPLDLLKLSGQIFTVKPPFTPGSEGSGIITQSNNKELIGKKVVFNSPLGSWRQYILIDEQNIILLNDDADLDSAACAYVNPLTCLGLVSTAQKYKAQGVVNLAATSALGKMINDLALERGLKCLNVIRGDKNRVEEIKQTYQNENVITQDQENFQKELKEYSERLSATVCFDPIGGAVTGQVFNNLPPNSTLIVYGSLSGKDIEGVNGVQVRWANKKIEGFSLFGWLGSLSTQERTDAKSLVQLKSNTAFKTAIETSFPFSEIKAALALVRSLKGGKKVLLKSFQ